MTKNYVGVDELAEFLDISKNTIYSWVWQKRIPYVKVGRLLKFNMRLIEAWLEEKTVNMVNL